MSIFFISDLSEEQNKIPKHIACMNIFKNYLNGVTFL